jgi:hypothetical protein
MGSFDLIAVIFIWTCCGGCYLRDRDGGAICNISEGEHLNI